MLKKLIWYTLLYGLFDKFPLCHMFGLENIKSQLICNFNRGCMFPCRSLFQEMRYIRNIQRSTRCTPGDMGKHRYSNSGRKNPKVFFKEKLKSNGDRKVIWWCLLVLWSMPIWWFSVLMDAKVWWSCKSVMVLKKV